jgi:hypothetical protein
MPEAKILLDSNNDIDITEEPEEKEKE